ncbi:acetyltransferase [Oceanisphaera sp. IT1-181]|uniref:acetyltransferase n=1 Tax=Oceanisphaera sp. IT1-181 TaxID=3081199 RepID=UPI0029CA458C|nr:acetyltransferase [Oceanisphaera sp. IT1-181]
MNKLAVLGASGHGKVLADMAELIGWRNITFFDDAWPELTQNGHWSVVGNTAALLSLLSEFDGVLIGIGNNAIRLEKQAQLASSGARLISMIHPAASVSSYAHIGLGSVIMAGAVVNVDAHLGDACIINTNASVDHDCILEAGVHISPNVALAGGVKVGQGAWLGIGACVRQLISIGAGAMVGAGAVVVKTVAPKTCVVGNPAREL